MLKRIAILGVGMAMFLSPIFVSAQSQNGSDANSAIIALLTKLVQTLEQELAALESALQNNSSSSFTATPTSGAAPLTVTFTGTFTTGYSLDFGDGSTPVAGAVQGECVQNVAVCGPFTAPINQTHIYTTAGTYTAKFSDANGSKTVTITVGGTVSNGTLTAIPSSGAAPLSVSFSTTPQNANDSYTLDFGDGTTGAMTTSLCNQIAGSGASCSYQLTHSYASAGTYVATVYQLSSFQNGADSSCSLPFLTFCGQAMGSVTITVTGAAQGSPTITYVSNSGGSVTASYANLPASAQIIVINQTSGVAVSGISSTVSGSGTLTLTGLSAGTFYLEAKDASGNYLAQSVSFTATDGTSTTLTATPSSGSAPLAVSFSYPTSPDALNNSYSVDFGDGQSATAQAACAVEGSSGCSIQANHTYTANGTYSATLTTPCSGTGCTAVLLGTATVTVGTQSSGSAFFVVSLSGGVAPLSTTFIAGGLTDPNSTYAVDFGDNTGEGTIAISCTTQGAGSGAVGATCSGSLAHIYTATGTYTATLHQYPNVSTTCTSFLLANCAGQVIGTITITVVAGTPGQMTSNFFPTPSSGPAPLTVTFMSDQGVRVLFGDGASGTLSASASGCVYSPAAINPYNCYGSVQHTYTAAGNYTAQLVDSNGNIIGRVTITVAAANNQTFIGGSAF